nr:MAG TPA: hypothetical protein [Caudoviricetes sp.]
MSLNKPPFYVAIITQNIHLINILVLTNSI